MSPRLRALLGEWLRFCGVGALSFSMGAGLSTLLHEWAGLPSRTAVGVSLGIMLLTNFVLNRVFVFRASGHLGGGFLKFAATALVLRGAEYLVFLALMHFLQLNYLVAFTLALILSNGGKFAVYRTVVFTGSRAQMKGRASLQ